MDNRVCGYGDGLLTKDRHRLFPIGFYELPKDDMDLKAMVASGVNLIRCGSKLDLDRIETLGAMGWISLPVQLGATNDLKEQILLVADHPALAVWEGPDEIVWNFTAWSHLWKKDRVGIFEHEGEWWMQTPMVINYSEQKSGEIMPKINEAIQLVRRLDPHNRQFWINEARDSDLKFVRQYINHIDIIGCDDYPIRSDDREAVRVGVSTDRWKQVGRNKPVWMVLQGYSWSDLEDYDRGIAYPTFNESRLMAYDCIVHGARGILYWGSSYLKSDSHESFRQSLYALTSELSALQSFLIAAEEGYVQVSVTEGRKQDENPSINSGQVVKLTARRIGRDWLIVLVNESNETCMGIEVTGLIDLEGTEFVLLYGNESITITRGELVTRMMPHQVKVFATSRKWETYRRQGRDFVK